jgi:dihydrofolate reductase
MREVILSMMVSVDGFIEASNPEEEWFVCDDEMAKYMMEFFSRVDTFLYGRVSYEAMLKYWPSATGEFADTMNRMPKIIFSRTLDKVGWNAKLIKDNIAEEIQKTKQQPGKDLALFAGADVASSFIKLGLIDEFRLIVNPVVLGSGKPLFKNIKSKLKLKLIKSKSFNCGNIILFYVPENL